MEKPNSLASPASNGSGEETSNSSNVVVSACKTVVRSIGHAIYIRFVYTPLAKRYFKELTYQSIPILFAASFSSFIMSLIRYISEESEGDATDNECYQTFIYSLAAYIIGYLLTISYRKAITAKEPAAWVKWLEEKELSEILFGVFSENSAFAWREFVNVFVLKILYLRYGWGQAVGGWLLMLFVFFSFTLLSGQIIKAYSFEKGIKDLLIEHDADSFALPLAFSFTVLWALGFELIGAQYVDTSGYLYEWKDDDSEEESSGVNGFYYLYLVFISTIVGLILVFEDRYCFQCFRSIEDSIESQDRGVSGSGNSISQDPTLSTTSTTPPVNAAASARETLEFHAVHGLKLAKDAQNELQEKVVFTEWIELWHGFLGCLVGVAFYTLIVDEFLPIGGHDSAGLVIIAFIVAILLNWKIPSCVAGNVSRQKVARKKFLQRREQNQQLGEEASCWSTFSEWYLHLSMHKRGAMLVSARLVIGWTWETAISELLNWIADASAVDDGLLVAIDFGVVLIAIVVSLLIHHLIRQLKIEEEADEITVEINAAVNPLQANVSPVESESMERK